ncbi:MAG: ABC transporter permease [Candidatus Heimdallarchaeota archaeon]
MDKSIAMSLKIIGFILIFTSAFVPLYTISFESIPAIAPEGSFADPNLLAENNGTLVRVLGFKIDYKLLSYNTAFNRTDAQFLSTEVPSSVIILSAALWFILIFAVLATILGQVFQSGGLKSRGTVADIAAAILLLCGLIAAILAMNRSMYIAAERYSADVFGQTANTITAITFNPNDQTPSYFNVELTGNITPGFYIFIIGILLMVTGIFLPVNWQQPMGSKMARQMGDTKVITWIKTVASLRLTTYVIRRLLTLIPLFIAICVMTFVMVSGMGDPVALLLLGKQRATEQDRINLTRKLGLDQPIYVQFIMWFYNLIRGNMGNSFTSGASINGMIGGLVWETLKLQLAAFALALCVSIPLGVIAAKNQNTWIDSTASALALLGQSMPIFVFGLVLIYIFSGYGLGWFPAAKAHRIPAPAGIFSDTNWTLFRSGDFSSWWANISLRLSDSLLHMALPTITLLFAFLALYTRLVRSTMLEVLQQDYILSARANGLSERVITWKHAFRNTLIPVVTFVGLFLATALAGAPITETLFTWPGLGFKYVQAIGFLDFPMILGTTAILTILILFGNLITDIIYVGLDPRIEL